MSIVCIFCLGTGFIIRDEWDGGEETIEPCSFCDGTGEVNDNEPDYGDIGEDIIAEDWKHKAMEQKRLK